MDELEHVRPELALQCLRGIGGKPGPERRQPSTDEVKGDAVAAQLGPDRQRIGRQRRLERERAIEPGEKGLGLVGIERGALDHDQCALAQLEHRPFQAVGRDADEMLAFLTFPVGQIVGHAALNIAPLAIEVALGFQHGATDQRIQPPAHLRHAPFEVERVERGAELGDQQLPEIGLHLVMARPRGEVAKQVERGRCDHRARL